MAEYCCIACKKAGSICDFCIYFISKEEDNSGEEGTCKFNPSAHRSGGRNCKYFHCFKAE